MTRVCFALVAVSLSVSAIAGCGGQGAFAPGRSTTPAAAMPKVNLDRFYQQQLAWDSCSGFGDAAEELGSQAQCAMLEVPIDYAKPEGDVAQIAVSRIQASGNRIGSLISNPGGPGQSGLSLASLGRDTRLAEHFDVVGFDPRGIGSSQPQLVCRTGAELDADRADLDVDMSAVGIAQTERENKAYADLCAQRVGANFLAHVGTVDVVRDLDVLRGVLGEEKLTFVGFSYGTRIGTAYAEAFPQQVRAMVLDGAIDPAMSSVDESINQAKGFQSAFEAYAADCAGERGCPVGNDPAQAVQRFHELVHPLMNRPAAAGDPRGLSYNDALTGTSQALYTTELWPLLTVGLTQLQAGDGSILLNLADLYNARRSDGTYDSTEDAFNAVRCADEQRLDDRAGVDRLDQEMRRIAPFIDDGMGTGHGAFDSCVFWPVPPSAAPPHEVQIAGLPPLVVVSTTNDPATPYQAGVNLARQLRASLITFRGDQHTVALTSGVGCVDEPVITYLVDLTPPPAELVCG